MNHPRAEASGVWVNPHQFLVVGGTTNAQITCEYYDLRTEQWTNLPMTCPVQPMDSNGLTASVGVVLVSDKLYLLVQSAHIGNGIRSRAQTNLISYDLSSCGKDLSAIDVLPHEPLLPHAIQTRNHFACCADEESQSIFVFGGYGVTGGDWGDLATAEKYDIARRGWEKLPSLPQPRSGCVASVVPGDKLEGGHVILIGGGLTLSSSTVLYDVVAKSYEEGPAFASLTVGFCLVPLHNTLVAIGGDARSASKSHTPLVEVLDPKKNVWNSLPSPISQARYYATAGFCQATQTVMLAGGFGDRRKRTTEKLVDAELVDAGVLIGGTGGKHNSTPVNNSSDKTYVPGSLREMFAPALSSPRVSSRRNLMARASSVSNRTMTKPTRRRAIDKEAFQHQSYASLQQHKLAASHLSSKHFYHFALPTALASTVAGMLAFVAISGLLEETTNAVLMCAIGALSFLVVLLQISAAKCKYEIRAALHESAVSDLVELRNDLEAVVGNTDNEQDDDETDEALYDLSKRYRQCLKGCKSAVPLEISDAFSQLDSRLQLLEITLGSDDGATKKDLAYVHACDDLVARFLKRFGWPLFLVHPTDVVDQTVAKLQTKILPEGNGVTWNNPKGETTPLLP